MYAKCKCGKVWNISIKAKIPNDGYKCPVCRSKERNDNCGPYRDYTKTECFKRAVTSK